MASSAVPGNKFKLNARFLISIDADLKISNHSTRQQVKDFFQLYENLTDDWSLQQRLKTLPEILPSKFKKLFYFTWDKYIYAEEERKENINFIDDNEKTVHEIMRFVQLYSIIKFNIIFAI